jgi:hypothetical protein
MYEVEDISSPFDAEDIDEYQMVRNYKFLGDMQYEEYIPAIREQIRAVKFQGMTDFINYLEKFETNYKLSVEAANYDDREIFPSLKYEYLSNLHTLFEEEVGVYLVNSDDIYLPTGYDGIRELYDNFIVTNPAEQFVKLYLADALRDVENPRNTRALFDTAVSYLSIAEEITNDDVFKYYPCDKVLKCMQGGIIIGNIYNTLLTPVIENKVDYEFIYYDLTT